MINQNKNQLYIQDLLNESMVFQQYSKARIEFCSLISIFIHQQTIDQR